MVKQRQSRCSWTTRGNVRSWPSAVWSIRNMLTTKVQKATPRASIPIATGSMPTGSPKLLPLIRELQANGVTGHQAIARELERRRIRTPRGGEWSSVQVRSIIKAHGGDAVTKDALSASSRQVRARPIRDCVVGIGEPGAVVSDDVDNAARAGEATALQLSLSSHCWGPSCWGYASTASSVHSNSTPTMSPARAFQKRMPTTTARIAGVTNRSASTAAAR